jgi:tetratricopeptide (TPR) repeat protein
MARKAGAADVLSPRAVIGRVLSVSLSVGMLLWLAFLPACNSQGSASRRVLREIRPANNTALLVQNAAYLKRAGRLELAVEDLEEAHLQAPDNMEILDALTQTYEELGDYDRAEELYKEALSRGGNHPAIENNRCYALYLQGRLDQAETCFRKSLTRQPDNQAARNNLGLVLCRQGRETEALAMWREALSDGEARQHLGQAMASLGKEVAPSLAGPAPAPARQQVATVVPPATPPAPVIIKKQASAPAPQARPAPSPILDASTPAAPAPPAAQAPPAVTASVPARSPAPAPSPARHTSATAASFTPEKAPARAAAIAAAAIPPAKKPVSPPPATASVQKPKTPLLMALDLEGTRIELKNGNGIHDQAREVRNRLSLEGFTVVGIGNHIDFGLEDTVIVYRPEAAKVAQALAQKFFPGAKLAQDGKMSPRADIRVSLGRDLAGEQHIAAAPPVSNESHKMVLSPVAPRPDYLTAQELILRIEIRNGNGITDQARETGGRLTLEGFRVAHIANNKDFGLEKTVIAYRPEATRLARVLYKKYFPEANLQEEGTLPPWTDVRVSLGRDLISGHRHLAQGYSGEVIP